VRQHAEDGYSRRGNVGGSLVHSMFFVLRLWFKNNGV